MATEHHQVICGSESYVHCGALDFLLSLTLCHAGDPSLNLDGPSAALLRGSDTLHQAVRVRVLLGDSTGAYVHHMRQHSRKCKTVYWWRLSYGCMAHPALKKSVSGVLVLMRLPATSAAMASYPRARSFKDKLSYDTCTFTCIRCVCCLCSATCMVAVHAPLAWSGWHQPSEHWYSLARELSASGGPAVFDSVGTDA
jgi:hypothetical protein